MKEEFKSDHWKDFAQRYQGTYGWYEGSDSGRILVYLNKVSEDRLSFLDKKGLAYFARPDQNNFFTFFPVEKGCYNYGEDDVISVRRHPARQWKRGLCQDNTTIESLSTKGNIGVGFDVLEHIFTEKPNRALERFKAAGIGNVAFNRTLAHVNGKLYIYNNVIGEFKNGIFQLDNPLFGQEVEDVVKRHQLQVSVVAAK